MKKAGLIALLMLAPALPAFADGNTSLGPTVQIISGGKTVATIQLPKGIVLFSAGRAQFIPATQSEPRRIHLSGKVRLEVQQPGQVHVMEGQVEQQTAIIQADEILLDDPSLPSAGASLKPPAR